MQDSGHKPPPSFYPDLEVERKTVTPIDEKPIEQIEDPKTTTEKTYQPPPSFYPDIPNTETTPNETIIPPTEKKFRTSYKWVGHTNEKVVNDKMWEFQSKGIAYTGPDGKGGEKWYWTEENKPLIDGLMSVYGIQPIKEEIGKPGENEDNAMVFPEGKEIGVTDESQGIPITPEEQEKAKLYAEQKSWQDIGNYNEQQAEIKKQKEDEQNQVILEQAKKEHPFLDPLISNFHEPLRVLSGMVSLAVNGENKDKDQSREMEKLGDALGFPKGYMKALKLTNGKKYDQWGQETFSWSEWYDGVKNGVKAGTDLITSSLTGKDVTTGKQISNEKRVADLILGPVETVFALTLTPIFSALPKDMNSYYMRHIVLAQSITDGLMSYIPNDALGKDFTEAIKETKRIVSGTVPLLAVGKTGKTFMKNFEGKEKPTSYSQRVEYRKEIGPDGKIVSTPYKTGRIVPNLSDADFKNWESVKGRISETRAELQKELDIENAKKEKDRETIALIEKSLTALESLSEKDLVEIQNITNRILTETEKPKTTDKRLKVIRQRTENPTEFPEFKTEEQKKSEVGTLIDTREGLTQLGDIKDREKLELIKELEGRIEDIDKVLTPGVSDELRRDAISKKSELNGQVESLKKEMQPIEDKNILTKREEELNVEINKEKKQGGKLIQRVEGDTPEAKQLNYKIDTHNKIVEASKTKEANNPTIPEDQFVKDWKNKSHEEQSKVLDRWDIEPTISEKGVDKKGLPYERITLKTPKQIYEEYTGKVKEFKDSKIQVDDLNRWKFIEDYSKLSKEDKSLYLKNNGLDNRTYRNPHEVFNEIAKRREENAIAQEIEKTENPKTEKPIEPEKPVIEKPIEEKIPTETEKIAPEEKPIENPVSVAELPVKVERSGDINPTGDNKAYSVLKALTEPENPIKWEELKTALKPEELGKMTNAEAKDLQKTLAQMREDGLIYPAGDAGYLATGKIEATPKGKEYIKEFQQKALDKAEQKPESISEPKTEQVSKPKKKEKKDKITPEKVGSKIVEDDNRSLEEIHNHESLMKEDIAKVEEIIQGEKLNVILNSDKVTTGNNAALIGNEIHIKKDASYEEIVMGMLHEVIHDKLNKREEKANGDTDILYNNNIKTIDNYMMLEYPEESLNWGTKERLTVTLTDILTLPNKTVSRGSKTLGSLSLDFAKLIREAQEEMGSLPTGLNITDPKSRLEVLNSTKEFKGSLIDQALHALGTYMGNKFKVVNKGTLDKVFQKSYDKAVDIFGGSGLLSQIIMDKVIKGQMKVGKIYLNDFSNVTYNFHKTMLNPKAADLIKTHTAETLKPLFDPIAELMKAEQDGMNLLENQVFYEKKQGEMLSYWKENIVKPLKEYDTTGKTDLTPEQIVALQEIQVRFGVHGKYQQMLARNFPKTEKELKTWNNYGAFYPINKQELAYHVATGETLNNPFVNNKYSANKRLNEMYTHPSINLEITNNDFYSKDGKWGLPEDILKGNNLIQADFPYLGTEKYALDKNNARSLSNADLPYAMDIRQKFVDEFKDQHIVFYDSNHPKIEEFINKNSHNLSYNKFTDVGKRSEYMATNGKRLFNGEAEAITRPATDVITSFVKVDPKAELKMHDASSILNPMFWVEQGKLTVKGYEIVKEALTSPEFKAKMVDAYIKLRDTGKDLAKNLGTAFSNIPYKILEKLPEWQKFVADVIKTGAETVKGIFTGDISLTGGNSLPMFIGGEGARRLKKGGREISEKIKGLDGKDRYWIEDGKMEISQRLLDAKTDTYWKMSDVVKHPELFEAYPFMKDWEIKKDFNMLTNHTKGDGVFTSDLGYITENGKVTLIGYNGRKVKLNIEKGWSKEQVGEAIKETIVHEIQHGIQKTEGFAPGGNSVDVITHLDSKQLQTELVKILPDQKRVSDIWYQESVKELDALNNTEKKIREADIEDVMRMNEIYTKSELWTAEESKEITKLQEKIFGVKAKTGIEGALSKPPYRLDYVASLLKGKGEEVKTKAQNNFDAESNRRDIIQHVEYYRDNNLPMKEKVSREYLNYLDYKSEGSISQAIYRNLSGEIEARISGSLSILNGTTLERAKQWLDGYRDKAVVLKPNKEMYNMNIDIARENGILIDGKLRPEVINAAQEVASKSKLFREFSNKLVGDLGEKIVPFVRMLWREFTENKHPEAVQQGIGFWRKNVPEIDPKVNKSKKLTNLDPIVGVSKREKDKFLKSHGQGIFASVEKHLGTMNNEAVTVPAINHINEFKSPDAMMESYLKRPVNHPSNNVEIEALKIMRGNTFVTLLDAFKAKGKSDAMKQVYAKSLKDFLSWTEILRGHTTTVARALQQAGADTKIMEFMSNPLNHGKNVEAVLKQMTLQNFHGNFDAILKATSKLEDAFTKPSIKDKGLYIFYNGLLGSMGVDVTNITGNVTHLGWEFAINHAWNPYGWKDLGLGAIKGGKMAWDIVKGRRDELSKFDVQDLRAMQREPWRYGIDYENKNNKAMQFALRTPGTIFRAAMVPTIRLEWQDAFFRSIGRQLMRGKVERGFKRTEFSFEPGIGKSKAEQYKAFKLDMDKSIDRILADGDLLDINSPKYKKLMEASPDLENILKGVASIDRYARHLVFQQELGPKGKGFQKALRETVLGTAVIPFFRIGVNTTKVSFQNSPLGLAKLTKSQIEAWTSNGKEIKNVSDWHRQNVYDFSQLTSIEKAQQIRRGIAGTTAMVGLGYAMINGLMTITGAGPKNSADREAWEGAGFRPYHIYLGDDINDKTGTSYQNLEHFGMPLAVLGGIGDYLSSTPKEKIPDSYYELAGTFLSLAAYNSGKYLTDQSYMQGLKDMLEAFRTKESFDKYMLRWAIRTGTSSIPFVRAIEGTRKLITGDRTMYEKNPPRIDGESYMDNMERTAEHEFVKNLGVIPRNIFFPNYKLEKQFTALGDEKQSSYQKHILPFSGDIQSEAGAWLYKNKLRVNVPEWNKVDGATEREYQLKSAKATKNFIMKYKISLDKDPDSRKKILGDIQEQIHELVKANPKIKEYDIEKAVDKSMKLLPTRVKTNNIFKKYEVKSEKTGEPYFYNLSDDEKEAGKIDKERFEKLTDDLIERTSKSNLSNEEKNKRYKSINNAVRDAKKLF